MALGVVFRRPVRGLFENLGGGVFKRSRKTHQHPYLAKPGRGFSEDCCVLV